LKACFNFWKASKKSPSGGGLASSDKEFPVKKKTKKNKYTF